MLQTPNLDEAEKLVHIVGLPAIIGALCWLVRTYNEGQKMIKDIAEGTATTVAALAEVREKVDTLIGNHMEHMQTSLNFLADQAEKQSECLNSISRTLISVDKGIGILVDRKSTS